MEERAESGGKKGKGKKGKEAFLFPEKVLLFQEKKKKKKEREK